MCPWREQQRGGGGEELVQRDFVQVQDLWEGAEGGVREVFDEEQNAGKGGWIGVGRRGGGEEA